jgi:outer membrane receptor protein involved in Fe transport
MNFEDLAGRVAAFSLAIVFSMGAQAQDDAVSGAEESEGIEEIIVTASKREESVQTVAGSVDVLNAEMVEALSITNLEDATLVVPSVSMEGDGGIGGASQVFFRGVYDSGNGNLGGGGVSSMVYLDETPINNTQSAPDVHAYDIQRIEFLNGPQGTLYGASSQSGTVKIVTKDVNLSEFEGGFDVEYGNIAHGDNVLSLEGFINIPLVEDKLGLRLVGWSDDNGGWIDNRPYIREYVNYVDEATGEFIKSDTTDVAEENFNRTTSEGFRAKLKYAMGDNWDATLSIFSQEDTRQGVWSVDPEKGGYETTAFTRDYGGEDMSQVALTVVGTFEWAQLTYAGSNFNREYTYNFDWSPIANYTGRLIQITCETFTATELSTCGDPQYNFETIADWDRETHEIRLASASDSAFQWIIGVYDEDLKLDYSLWGFGPDLLDRYSAYQGPELISVNDDTVGTGWLSYNDRTDEETAYFGQLSYTIGDLTATYGHRSFETDTRIDIRTIPNANFYFWLTEPFDSLYESSESQSVRMYNLKYQFDDDFMVYALQSEGYRPGGPNRTTNPLIPDSYDADVLENTEIGLKSTMLDNHLQFNLSYFRQTWDGFQSSTWNPELSAFTFTDNVGFVDIDGIEANLQWYPTDSLKVFLSATSIDSEITTNFNFGYRNITEGTELAYTPELSGSLTIMYDRPLSNRWDAYLTSSTYGVGKMYADLSSDPDRIQTSGYVITNLRLGGTRHGWSTEFYIANLLDKKTRHSINLRTTMERTLRPRTVGIRLGYRF